MYSQIEKLAKLVVEYSAEVKKGERVLIDGDPTGTPLLHLNLHKEILKKGAVPFHKSQLGDLDYVNLVHAEESQLRAIAEDDTRIINDTDVVIGIEASTNPRRVDTVSPENTEKFQKAAQICQELVYKRVKEGTLRMVFVEYPTNGNAQDCGMSLVEYEDHFCRACFLDEEDPTDAWKKLSEKHEKSIRFLNGKNRIRIEGNGTDLTFSTRAEDANKWTSESGKKCLPDGEISTEHHIKDSVNGSILFTYPGIFRRREIKDIKLEFKQGKIVNATSSTEEQFLQKLLLSDEEEVHMGAFGMGTNYKIEKFIGHIAFDEKIGGTIHLTLRGSPSWVLLKRMEKNERIYADNELFYDDSNFVI
jgi:aminopeptidase